MVIEAVLPARFPTWVTKRPFMVLFVGDGPRTPRPSLVVEGLELSFPRQVGAGWMARDTAPSSDWFERAFVTELGPYRRGGRAPAGVYLFHLGWVVGHHPFPAPTDRAGWLDVRGYVVERIRLKSSHGADDTEWVRTGADRAPTPPPAARRDAGPYEVLEVDAEADDVTVKKAYRTALKLNHPDRVAHLSKALQEFAHERTQLILAAWEAIKEERGLR